MIINKITTGFVIQKFDTEAHKFISQEFIATPIGCSEDQVAWETEFGEPIKPATKDSLAFDMIQPSPLRWFGKERTRLTDK